MKTNGFVNMRSIRLPFASCLPVSRATAPTVKAVDSKPGCDPQRLAINP